MKTSVNKFYPNNPKWLEPYCNYLGSIVYEGINYDLGIWVSPCYKHKSWFFVQSEELGDYQSGSITYNNKLNTYILKNPKHISRLPIIETVILAKRLGYFKKTILKNFNFNLKYLSNFDITRFLLCPYKTKNITVYLKKNFIKLQDVMVLEDPVLNWKNQFFHKGKYYSSSDILLIES